MVLKWLEDSLARRRWHHRLSQISHGLCVTLQEAREAMQMLACPIELATDNDLLHFMQQFEIASKRGEERKFALCNMSMRLSDFLRNREEQHKVAILDSLPPGTPRRCDAAGLEHKWWHVSKGEPLKLPEPIMFCSTGMEFPPTDWTRRVCHRCGVKQLAVKTDGDYKDYQWEVME